MSNDENFKYLYIYIRFIIDESVETVEKTPAEKTLNQLLEIFVIMFISEIRVFYLLCLVIC